MRISDWSSDVCSSDLHLWSGRKRSSGRSCWRACERNLRPPFPIAKHRDKRLSAAHGNSRQDLHQVGRRHHRHLAPGEDLAENRSEEHTSELQSLMRISYAVFCLKKKNIVRHKYNDKHHVVSIIIEIEMY